MNTICHLWMNISLNANTIDLFLPDLSEKQKCPLELYQKIRRKKAKKKNDTNFIIIETYSQHTTVSIVAKIVYELPRPMIVMLFSMCPYVWHIYCMFKIAVYTDTIVYTTIRIRTKIGTNVSILRSYVYWSIHVVLYLI